MMDDENITARITAVNETIRHLVEGQRPGIYGYDAEIRKLVEVVRQMATLTYTVDGKSVAIGPQRSTEET